jgi:hypothetical protein
MIRNRPWAPPLIALTLIALAVFAASVLNSHGREEVPNTPEGLAPSAPKSEAVPTGPLQQQSTPRYLGAVPAPDPAASAGVAPSPGVPANSVLIDPYDASFQQQVQAALHRSSTP